MFDAGIFTALSTEVLAFTEWAKSLLLQTDWFVSLTKQQQAIFLVPVSVGAAMFGAYMQNINLFPQAPTQLAGIIGTGLVCGGGGALLHAVLGLMGKNSGASAQDVERNEAALWA